MKEKQIVNNTLDNQIDLLLSEMSMSTVSPSSATLDPLTKILIDGILAQNLTEQELMILIRFFGLDGDAPVSLDALARQLDWELSALAQRFEQILSKLRQVSRDEMQLAASTLS